jgi:GntR family transcriptional regulator
LSCNNYHEGMLFRIDPGAPAPLFSQLADQVRTAAIRGELAPGQRLPSARDLAESLDINLHTVLRAYQDLRGEGLIELRRGRGAVVTVRAAQDLAALRTAVASVAALAKSSGISTDTTLALVKEALR